MPTVGSDAGLNRTRPPPPARSAVPGFASSTGTPPAHCRSRSPTRWGPAVSDQPVRRRPAISSGALAVLVAAAVALVLGSGCGSYRNSDRTGRTGRRRGRLRCVASRAETVGSRARWRRIPGLPRRRCRLPRPGDGPERAAIQSLPAMLGVAVLAAALVPVRGTGSRSLVKLGVGFVFCSVLLAGFFQSVNPDHLLGATAASVVAWNAGEQAIGLGEQLGRSATTWRLELVHVGGNRAGRGGRRRRRVRDPHRRDRNAVVRGLHGDGSRPALARRRAPAVTARPAPP